MAYRIGGNAVRTVLRLWLLVLTMGSLALLDYRLEGAPGEHARLPRCHTWQPQAEWSILPDDTAGLPKALKYM